VTRTKAFPVMFFVVLTSLLIACTREDTATPIQDYRASPRTDILNATYKAMEARTVSVRKDALRVLVSPGLITLGKAEWLPDRGVYVVRYTPDPYKPTEIEVWEYDAQRDAVAPANSAALLTAVYLFCLGPSDSTSYCRSYYSELERLKRTLK